jgi:hypothetical protein
MRSWIAKRKERKEIGEREREKEADQRDFYNEPWITSFPTNGRQCPERVFRPGKLLHAVAEPAGPFCPT